MNEERRPQQILEWCPPGRRRRRKRKGKPRNSWKHKVTARMTDKDGLDWQGRIEKKNKIKTLGTEICEKLILYA